jgi:hypothetical protein
MVATPEETHHADRRFFPSAGIRLAAHLYTPAEPNGRAIIIGHPGTATKEQSPRSMPPSSPTRA